MSESGAAIMAVRLARDSDATMAGLRPVRGRSTPACKMTRGNSSMLERKPNVVTSVQQIWVDGNHLISFSLKGKC
jgi:hypothetical protein